MKRTALVRKTPLAQGASLLRRAPLVRSSVLPRVSARARAGRGPRAAAERALGRSSQGMGTCARCGLWRPVNGHERVGRSQGGDPTRPDCLLCVPCNTWCEDNPQSAAWDGWKVSRLNGRHPYLNHLEARRVDGSTYHFDHDYRKDQTA